MVGNKRQWNATNSNDGLRIVKFLVRRTSHWGDDPPCEESIKIDVVRVDRRTTNDPAKIPAGKGGDTKWWYAKGKNHRIDNNQICRDFDEKGWAVEINNLDDLIAFGKKYGDLVFSLSSWQVESMPSLEIYDTYRE